MSDLMKGLLVFVATDVLAAFVLLAAMFAPKQEPDKIDAAVMVLLEAHEPLHIDQLHQLLELTEKQPPTVAETCESLQRLVVVGKVEISTKENNPKWRPLTVLLWDDAGHKKNEEGTEKETDRE